MPRHRPLPEAHELALSIEDVGAQLLAERKALRVQRRRVASIDRTICMLCACVGLELEPLLTEEELKALEAAEERGALRELEGVVAATDKVATFRRGGTQHGRWSGALGEEG